MSYTFILEFRGLCAFVPSHGIDQDNDLVSVLLVNATNDAKDNFNEHSLAEHFPLIRCKAKDLQGATGLPEDADVMVRLNAEDVVLVPEKVLSPSLKVEHGLKGEGDEEPTDDKLPDFSWVPLLEKVRAGAGELIPGLLDIEPTEARVIARVHLAEGELRTWTIGRHQGIPVVEVFRGKSTAKAAPALRQAVATRVRLAIEVEGPVKLLTIGFGQEGTAEREVLFKPAEDGKERLVEVLNLCAEALLESDEVRKRPNPKPDRDFAWFYLLSKEGLGKRLSNLPIPRPIRDEWPEGEGGGEPARCTKTTFNSPPGSLGLFRDLVARVRSR